MKNQTLKAIIELETQIEQVQSRIDNLTAEDAPASLVAKEQKALDERKKAAAVLEKAQAAYDKVNYKLETIRDEVQADAGLRAAALGKVRGDLYSQIETLKVQKKALLDKLNGDPATNLPYIPTQGDMERVARDMVERCMRPPNVSAFDAVSGH